MADIRWRQIKAAFEAALAAPETIRDAVLDRECAGDVELRREVASLLSARTLSLVRTAGAARAVADAPANNPPSEQPGTLIGRYKLLQPIGEGGFGVVWMAEQREPVKRLVALKIIKLGMDTRQVIARFEAERQALAMMDHPNVARVFDAGETGTGRPYFVMEYIKGVPLCEYCDTAGLDTRGRLELFGSVCNAIQHAHMKGIIHRDIKPANVLVTMHDGVPVPKVIDFGIAKATDSELTTRTLFTEHRQLIGTPAYMSPEQAEMSGLDIDTRSDIYSLGVLLYELLTGTTPFDTRALMQAGFAEMMRTIREVEPPKPSTRLSSLGDSGARSAQHARTDDTKKLGQNLRGDLDWIVMKCLEKDRTRRYETASALAADIHRHLNDEPVTAGAPGARYRLRKFIRRHRAGVAAAGMVAAALVLGVIGTTAGLVWALNEKTKARQAAESESVARAAAEGNERKAIDATAAAEAAKEKEAKARKRAETISAFVTTALKSGDAVNSSLAGGGADAAHDMTILAAMTNAITDIDSGRFRDDPETESELRRTIGVILMNNGRYDEARPLLERSLLMNERLFNGDGLVVANNLNDLGNLHQHQREYAKAEPLYARALAIWERASGPNHPNVATCLDNMAALCSLQGRLTEAESLVSRAIAIEERTANPDERRLATRLNTLASIRYGQGQYAESAALMTRVLAIWEKTRGPDHPEVAAALHNLATLQEQLANYGEAESLFRRSIAITEKVNGPDHPSLADILRGLAAVYVQVGKAAEAEPLQKRAIAIYERSIGPDHPKVLAARGSLAAIFWNLHQFEKSIPLFEAVVKAQEAALGRQHPDTLTNIGNLGVNYKDSGRVAEAIPLLEEAARAAQQHAELSIFPAQLLDAYIKAADPARPESVARVADLMRELLAPTRAKLPKDSPELAARIAIYATKLIALRAWDEAEPFVRETLAIREASAPDAWTTFNTRSMLGGVLLGQGRLAEAEPLLLDGYKGMTARESSIPAAGKVRIPETLERLVRLYEARGDESEAAAWRARLENARSAQPSPSDIDGRK